MLKVKRCGFQAKVKIEREIIHNNGLEVKFLSLTEVSLKLRLRLKEGGLKAKDWDLREWLRS